MTIETRILRVTHTAPAARGIQRFELQDPEGRPLPGFTAGAHVRVKTPSGAWRSYSLCNEPAQTTSYEIAVKREVSGRGGSVSLIDGVSVGDLLEVQAPENQFALDDRAARLLLIAGGIGITPLMAMIRQLEAEGRPYQLVYLTRDAESTAFLDELRAPERSGQIKLHHDQGEPSKALDLWPLLEKPGSLNGLHLYCCGPTGLMEAVRDMSGHWPASAVHFESFGVDTQPKADDQPFEITLRSSGQTLTVPVGQTILQTLRHHGLAVPFSCESGTCGSCKTGLLQGQADHRDMVLMADEKATRIMVCVSRAHSSSLVLDL
jgi:phthalate 4,5-dioxygenase reductase component